MIIDERMVTYINSLDTGHTPFLENLERTAKQDRVPIIRREMQSFLKVFLKMKQPKRILEVGTAVGFSAVFMAQYGEADAEITTIENYEKRIPIARENFEKSGFADRITLIPGDAAEVLKTLDGPYDFIFMDAAKGQYIHFLPEVLRLLDEHGVLITDNVLQDGDVIESHFVVERRNRTIHKRMREYLFELTHNPELLTSVVPLGDGIAITMKQRRQNKTSEGIPEQKEPGSRMIERVERKQHEKTGITGPGQQPGGIKSSRYLWRRCRIHRRRGLRTSGESKKLFDGGHERRHRICACTWREGLCNCKHSGT